MNRCAKAWSGCAVPPLAAGVAQPELLLHAKEQALVPLLGRRLGAELGQIDDDRLRALARRAAPPCGSSGSTCPSAATSGCR